MKSFTARATLDDLGSFGGDALTRATRNIVGLTEQTTAAARNARMIADRAAGLARAGFCSESFATQAARHATQLEQLAVRSQEARTAIEAAGIAFQEVGMAIQQGMGEGEIAVRLRTLGQKTGRAVDAANEANNALKDVLYEMRAANVGMIIATEATADKFLCPEQSWVGETREVMERVRDKVEAGEVEANPSVWELAAGEKRLERCTPLSQMPILEN